MNIQFNRIILFVTDAERLKHFYQSHFGFTVQEEIKDEWVILKAGTAEIALHRIGEAYRNDIETTNTSESNVKLVFETDEDVAALRETLLQKNIPMREAWQYEGFLFCDGEDPEGNMFQLKQKIV